MRPVSKDELPTMNKVQRRRVAVLRERHRYLTSRLQTGTCPPSARSYVEDEIDALEWAIERVTS